MDKKIQSTQNQASALQTYATVKCEARSVTDIAQWIAQHSHEAIESNKAKAWLRRFVKPSVMREVDITNAGYHRYFTRMDVETDPLMVNMLGYSAELTFKLHRDAPQRVDASYFPGIYINGKKPSQGSVDNTYVQHIFMPAAEWPFITAHMVFDWLNSAVSYQVTPSDKYAMHYLGITTLSRIFFDKILSRDELEPIIQRMHENSFPHMPWQTLNDLHSAGILTHDKNAFTDWLCVALLKQEEAQRLNDLPESLYFL